MENYADLNDLQLLSEREDPPSDDADARARHVALISEVLRLRSLVRQVADGQAFTESHAGKGLGAIGYKVPDLNRRMLTASMASHICGTLPALDDRELAQRSVRIADSILVELGL